MHYILHPGYVLVFRGGEMGGGGLSPLIFPKIIIHMIL
jgi:hypothetical protein